MSDEWKHDCYRALNQVRQKIEEADEQIALIMVAVPYKNEEQMRKITALIQTAVNIF